MIFRGYIDESYGANQNIFSLSCLIAGEREWGAMERKWRRALRLKNRELRKASRPEISRYHASDCSGCRNEFDGWTRDERDQFVLSLFELFKGFPSHTVVYDAQMDDICEVFPEWSHDKLGAAYQLLTGFVMHQIGRDFEQQSGADTGGRQPITISLFHDRTGGNGRYDHAIFQSFNRQKNDPDFRQRHYFTTIAPLGWEDSLALQPADLVAFECFKEAEARIQARKSRRSYEALLDMGTFGIHSMSFNKKAIRALRARMEEQQRLGLIREEE